MPVGEAAGPLVSHPRLADVISVALSYQEEPKHISILSGYLRACPAVINDWPYDMTCAA